MLLIVNEHHLRQVLTEYLIHYNTARPQRTLGQLTPAQAHARPRQIDVAEHCVGRKQVSAASRTSIRSPLDSRALLRKVAGHNHIRAPQRRTWQWGRSFVKNAGHDDAADRAGHGA